jgi:hypothetical protein
LEVKFIEDSILGHPHLQLKFGIPKPSGGGASD